MAYIIDNNVLGTLHTAIVPATTSIIIDAALAPNKSAVPAAGNIATLTLVDSVVSPTKIEIITYTTATNNGDGTYTLTGVTRGTEGTTAQSFGSSSIYFNAITAATFNSVSSLGVNTLLQFCGSGSDGDLVLNTPITLSADTYFRNLTIGAGGSICTGGYVLYVNGVLDLTAAPTGAIYGAPGTAGVSPGAGTSGGAGGAGAVGVTVPGGSAGGSEAGVCNQPGSNGISANYSIRADGGDGGKANSSTRHKVSAASTMRSRLSVDQACCSPTTTAACSRSSVPATVAVVVRVDLSPEKPEVVAAAAEV